MDLNKHSCLWVEDMAQPKHRNRKERVVWGTANESVTLGWRTVEGWNGNVARNHCNVDIEIQMNKIECLVLTFKHLFILKQFKAKQK